MKKLKTIIFFAVSIFWITACGKKVISDDGPLNVQTREETKVEALEADQTGNDENAAYEEYINSLRYLDDLYKEFLIGRISVENPFNPDFPITSYEEVFYWQEEEGAFPIETLEKKFALVDLNDDQTEELIFKISSGIDELMYILGIWDGELRVCLTTMNIIM